MRDKFKDLEEGLEADLERALIRVAGGLGWILRKASWVGVRGAPDRICFGPGGAILFVELKRGSRGVISEGQAKEIETLRRMGQEVWIVSGIDDLAKVARRMKELCP